MGSQLRWCLLWTLLYQLTCTKAADYLYSVLPFEESDPVLEYEPPDAHLKNAQGEEVALRPDFLYAPDQGHRVVLYYLPWCPHCQAYVPTYIALARRVQELVRDQIKAEEEAEIVEFYAVSCLPNKQLCKDQHVGGVPGIKLFPAGSIEGKPADPLKLHPFQVLRILGLSWGKGVEDDWDNLQPLSIGGGSSRALLRNTYQATGKRNKRDVFEDAYRSFHFAMTTEIYMKNGALEEKPRKVLGDWLLLLQNSLPISWRRMQDLLQDLVDNFEVITQDENNLLAILGKHPPKLEEWSSSCSHGQEGEGFTCGLWKLFHIMTIGVVQFNENGIPSNEESFHQTADAAQTLRDFIEQFFACSVCRKEFLEAFDSCAHERCHRLLTAVGKKNDWVELPLWLWEEHNSVRIRLMREHAKNKPITAQDTDNAQWPSRQECVHCWKDDGSSYDKSTVYKYLLEEYWPGFDHADAKERDWFGPALSADSLTLFSFVVVIVPLVGMVSLLAFSCRIRQKKKRSGRHKKLDL